MSSSWSCDVIQTPLVASSAPTLPILPTARKGDVKLAHKASGTWPAKTDEWCWHCCHPFEGPPLPLPVRHDDKLDVFHVVGTFCSWACMKAYNMQTHSSVLRADPGVLTLFRKRCTGGKAEAVTSAPPRMALRAFGGPMTIEEFRGCDKHLMFVPPRMITQPIVLDEAPSRLRDPMSSERLNDAVSFADASTRNDMLRLRRPKPLPATHNLLVRAMGGTTSGI